jgi:mono/diheme cytochrome c family protein
MKVMVSTIVILLFLIVAGAGAVVYSGIYDVGASEPHWAPTRWVLETARLRSIRMHASGIVPPSNLNEENRVVAGTAHFHEDCSVCHAAPGGKAKDLADGMYPQPPSLKTATTHLSPREIFWIIKHGIKMSGMPSWGDHSDDELWNIVAFIQKLPDMTAKRYADLVKASATAGGMKMK